MKQISVVLSLVCFGISVLGQGVVRGQSTGSIVGWGLRVAVEQSALAGIVVVAAGMDHGLGLKSSKLYVPMQTAAAREVLLAGEWRLLARRPVTPSLLASVSPVPIGTNPRSSAYASHAAATSPHSAVCYVSDTSGLRFRN